MNKTKIDWCDSAWNPVPDYPGYFASDDGKILSLKRKNPHIMKPIKSKDGYLYVFMYGENGMKKVWVHRAVLSAFSGNSEIGLECRHLDDNPQNNNLSNLAWGSRAQNVEDKKRNGRLPVGEKSGTHKLTEKQVKEIRNKYGRISLRKLAKIYGVSHTAIRRAALGIKWSYLKEEKDVKN